MQETSCKSSITNSMTVSNFNVISGIFIKLYLSFSNKFFTEQNNNNNNIRPVVLAMYAVGSPCVYCYYA